MGQNSEKLRAPVSRVAGMQAWRPEPQADIEVGDIEERHMTPGVVPLEDPRT